MANENHNTAGPLMIEDILQDSLQLLGGDAVSDEEGIVRYGPLTLTVSPKVRISYKITYPSY
jgi:hypothetical protein